MNQYQPSTNYPPPPEFYQQVPHKRSTPWPIMVAVGTVLGFLLGLTIGYGAHAPSASTPVVQATTQETTATTSQPTSAPTQASRQVGSTATSGVWQVTINSAKTLASTEFDMPKAGNIYLLINFTAKDIDTKAQDMSPIFFTLRNEQGDTYDLAYIDVPSNPRGPVVAGQQLRGDLSYEVPKSLHTFVLQFDSPEDLSNSQIVQWTITK